MSLDVPIVKYPVFLCNSKDFCWPVKKYIWFECWDVWTTMGSVLHNVSLCIEYLKAPATRRWAEFHLVVLRVKNSMEGGVFCQAFECFYSIFKNVVLMWLSAQGGWDCFSKPVIMANLCSHPLLVWHMKMALTNLFQTLLMNKSTTKFGFVNAIFENI